MPSPAVGWDASPRGERGVRWADVTGVHPYTPVTVGVTPELLQWLVEEALTYADEALPVGKKLINIFAWNETTEGAVLVPRLRPDGTVDDSLLRAVRRAITASRR